MADYEINEPLEEIISSTPDSDETAKLDDLKYKNHFYFKPRKIERWKDGLLYKLLGVHIFKKIVPTCGEYVNRLFVHKKHRPIAGAKSKEEGLRNYEPQTRFIEKLHAPASVICTPFLIRMVNEGDYEGAVAWGLVNLFVNIFPTMLQRYNRARIYNALDEIESIKC